MGVGGWPAGRPQSSSARDKPSADPNTGPSPPPHRAPVTYVCALAVDLPLEDSARRVPLAQAAPSMGAAAATAELALSIMLSQQFNAYATRSRPGRCFACK